MLRFNENDGSFNLYTNDIKAAEDAGLTLSTSVRGSKGEKLFFTANDNMKPVFNPYAVMEFYDDADSAARERLHPLMSDYRDSWADNNVGAFPSPPGHEYLPYQRAGIAYAIERGNCILGDEPGLGKTIQAIGIANATGARRILVVCPASILLNWRREIHEWSTIQSVRSCVVLTGKHNVGTGAHYTICSYNMLLNERIHGAFRAQDWDLIIADEGHYLKTIDAQRTRAFFGGGAADGKFYKNGLVQNTKQLVALTGTPLPNRPREAYTLARGLDWSSIDFLSQDAFMARFNPSGRVSSGHTVEYKGRLPELNARLRCNIMVRRLKKDVLPQLPDKRYEMTYIEPDGAIRDILAREALIDFDPRLLFNPDFSLDGTPIATLRREMGEAMVERVVEYVKYMLDVVEHPKLILFAHHRSVISALVDALEKYNPVLHIGGMSPKNKDKSIKTFISQTLCRLFVAQHDTMEGVDGLQQVCADVIFPEPAWTPGRNEQNVDRAHRIGQHGNVVAHFLLVQGSFNEKVLDAVLDKAVDIHATLDRKLV